MTLQLEAGKYYRAKNGEKCGPVLPRPGTLPSPYKWIIRHGEGDKFNKIYTDDGENYENGEYNLVAEWIDEPATEALALPTNAPETETFGPLEIKAELLAEAGRIVNGARRAAYGTPEMNFERIARFWQVYFQNTGRDVEITAADVSPMMRLTKEARLCETPDHYDSFVDIIGYTLTGAEVNKVNSPK